MRKPKTFKYADGLNGAMEVVLLRRQYTDGSLAVQMLCQTDGYWEFWGDVTVNLCDAANQNASFAYVDTNNMPAAEGRRGDAPCAARGPDGGGPRSQGAATA